MFVLHIETGRKISATITQIDAKEIAFINKSKQFDFNWNKEKKHEVYKLTCDGVEEILGLMSLQHRALDYAYEIKLLASSKENVGTHKKYGRIAGCLIAYACVKAFQANYGGYICLKPKTNLKTHYQEIYGMVSTKMYLVTEGQNSLRLIKEYYES